MSFISITNTFTSATLIESGKMNQNFSVIASGLMDGLHDISMYAGNFNGQVGIASGTTAAPALYLGADATTGLYAPQTSVVGFSAQGNEVGRVGSAGTWQIGANGSAATHVVYGNFALNNGATVVSGLLNVTTHEELTEISAPSSAASGTQKFYAGTDSLLHSKTEEGYDYPLGQTDFNGIIGSPTVSYLGSRQIRIAHPFSYYFQGIKFNSTADVDVTVPNTTGNYLIYFTDAKGTAVADLSSTYDFFSHVLYAGFYWNSASSDYMFFEERHGYLMDDATHAYLHRTRGAAYRDGGAISGYVIGSSTLADVQVAIDQTRFNDEDIALTLAARTEGTNWDKWYRGANGNWLKDTADTIPAFHASNIAKINTETAAPTWSLTSVSNGDFFNTYIFGTNSAESANRYIVIPGQAVAATLAAGQALGVSSLSLGTLPVQEIIPMYQLTWQYGTGGSYTGNDARVILRGVIDLRRTVSPSVSAGVTTSHNSLGGRSDTDSHPASAITNTPSGNLAATDIQTAVNELQTDIDTVAVSSASGGKNYITNPSAKFNTNGWTAANITATRDTSTDIPRQTTSGTAFKLVSTAGSSTATYLSDAILLDDADLTKKLGIELAINVADASNWSIDVLNSATSGGTYTRIPLSTDVSSITYLPAAVGVFKSTADMDSSKPYIKFQITSVATSKTAYFSDIIVTPSSVIQGAVVTDWMSFTPVWPSGGFGTVTNIKASYRRVGSSLELMVKASTGTVTASAQYMELPLGLNVDTTKVANSGGTHGLQNVGVLFIGAAAPAEMGCVVTSDSSTRYITFASATDGYPMQVNTTTDYITSSDTFNFTATIPIAEWSGSGTVNLAQNDVEYASNYSTSTTASDTTSFAYGPAGNLIKDITSELSRRVRFKSPIQNGDQLWVEVSTDGYKWSAVGTTWGVGGSGIIPRIAENTTSYGLGLYIINTTDVDVLFSTYANMYGKTTVGGAGQAWSAGAGSAYWRVRKTSAGAAVGFGIVSGTSSGLMPSTNANLDDAAATRLGLKQYLHGTTYNGGNAPTVTCNIAGLSVSRAVFVPYETQDGAWRLKFNISATFNSGTYSVFIFYINGILFKNIAGYYQAIQGNPGSGSAALYQQNVDPNTNQVAVRFASSTQAGGGVSGDLELDSKPTWAY